MSSQEELDREEFERWSRERHLWPSAPPVGSPHRAWSDSPERESYIARMEELRKVQDAEYKRVWVEREERLAAQKEAIKNAIIDRKNTFYGKKAEEKGPQRWRWQQILRNMDNNIEGRLRMPKKTKQEMILFENDYVKLYEKSGKLRMEIKIKD